MKTIVSWSTLLKGLSYNWRSLSDPIVATDLRLLMKILDQLSEDVNSVAFERFCPESLSLPE